MKAIHSSVTTNNYLIRIFRPVLIRFWAFVVTVFSLSLGRKLVFALLAVVVLFFLIGFIEPYALMMFNKIFGNPELEVFNQCVLGVIENAPLDEEFSWRLSACGEAPARFKWNI